jgi:UDP:flavonoid glycosyltransferase YjiC (YdhE family)
VGSAESFSSTTCESLVADLRRILAPEYTTRVRELATRMTAPSQSVTEAADLFEEAANRKTR